MAGVKTLADKNIKITMLTTTPATLQGIPLATLTSGTDVSCLLAASGTRFTATASESIADPAVCEDANTQVFGASNYEASAAPFWLLDATTGKYAAADNPTYEALRQKGSRVVFVLREGPKYDVAWAATDHYEAYEVITDNPQRPTEQAGYVKRIIPLAVQRAELHGVVGSA